jgi:hypothetical protein
MLKKSINTNRDGILAGNKIACTKILYRRKNATFLRWNENDTFLSIFYVYKCDNYFETEITIDYLVVEIIPMAHKLMVA